MNNEWLDIQNRLVNIDGKCRKDKMQKIMVRYIYADKELNISSILEERIDLITSTDFGSTTISRDKLLFLIQNRKKYEDKKYKFNEILIYNIDVEPENLQSYNKLTTNFLRPMNIMNEIVIPPSLFIFHRTNCIYIIFNEISKCVKRNFTRKKNYLLKDIINLDVSTGRNLSKLGVT